MEGDTIVMTDIFKHDPAGPESEPTQATGMRPYFMQRLEAAGIHLGADVFSTGAANTQGSKQGRKTR
jgi:hypothetical protein